jgi:hypothetical protein
VASSAGVMRRRQILQYWMRRCGALSLASQERFLQRQGTARLTRYPDEIVRKGIGWSNLLADALRFAHSAYEVKRKPCRQNRRPRRDQSMPTGWVKRDGIKTRTSIDAWQARSGQSRTMRTASNSGREAPRADTCAEWGGRTAGRL